jgi:glucuronokinase
MDIITERCNARVGILGNPSDGYFGATISATIQNYWVQVVLYEWPRLEIVPGPADADTFANLEDLVHQVRLNGYYGGARLIKATIVRFWDYVQKSRVALERGGRNFSIRYETNIPRQVGLAGSSAIIIATLKALCRFYKVTIPPPIMANVALSAEKDELGILAGLQDRVAQVFGGLVFMDFRKELMTSRGYGEYERLDPAPLPPLYLAFLINPQEGKISGAVHSDVRQRFDAGDPGVIKIMEDIAQCARLGRKALAQRDLVTFKQLMNRNFDLRASIYNLSPRYKEMIELGRALGATAKFPGSGGAIIGTYEGEQMFRDLEQGFAKTGCKVVKVVIG